MRVKMDRITTEKLIKLVRRHPELYDEKHKDYGEFLQREAIWQNISKQMGIRGEICKAKWNVLRGSYRRAQRYRESGLADWSKAWRYEDQMSFLRHCLRPQKTPKKPPQLPLPPANVNPAEEVHEENISIKQERLGIEDEVECEESKLYDEPLSARSLSRSNSSAGDLEETFAMTPTMMGERESSEETDPMTKFFLALAETVKTFPPMLQVQIKRDVFNCVHEAEVKMLQDLNKK